MKKDRDLTDDVSSSSSFFNFFGRLDAPELEESLPSVQIHLQRISRTPSTEGYEQAYLHSCWRLALNFQRCSLNAYYCVIKSWTSFASRASTKISKLNLTQYQKIGFDNSRILNAAGNQIHTITYGYMDITNWPTCLNIKPDLMYH